MERQVKSAAAQFFGRGKAHTIYEHGHWWVKVEGDDDGDKIYSVVDAYGPGTIKGFYFEEF